MSVQGGGRGSGQLWGPTLLRVCTWDPFRELRDPPAHCSEAPKGPVLSPVTTQATHWPGELTRTASEVFWQLLPIEFAGRGRELCADPPHPGLTTTKTASTWSPASAGFTWFSGSMLQKG